MSLTKSERKFSIHILQFQIALGSIDKNIHRAEQLIQKRTIAKGDLILLPEMFSSGFWYDELEAMAQESGKAVNWMKSEARSLGVAMAGSVPEKTDNGIVNSMLFVDEYGNVPGSYSKIHLFPLTGEERAFIPGSRPVVLDWSGLRIGLMICFDLRFPELSRRLCLNGADIILVSAQWPEARIEHFFNLVHVRAMENQFFVAASNACGNDGTGLILGGRSLCADPMGNVMGCLDANEDILSVHISPGDVTRIRKEFPVLSLRRPDSYR